MIWKIVHVTQCLGLFPQMTRLYRAVQVKAPKPQQDSNHREMGKIADGS